MGSASCEIGCWRFRLAGGKKSTYFHLVLAGFTRFWADDDGSVLSFRDQKSKGRRKKFCIRCRATPAFARGQASTAAPSDGALADELSRGPLYVEEPCSHGLIVPYFYMIASILLLNHSVWENLTARSQGSHKEELGTQRGRLATGDAQ
jgi:hypothetical protein